MSEDGEKRPPNVAKDLDLSDDSSESDEEAVVAVSAPEAAMDQGETPPVGPRPEPSTAVTAVEEDRPSSAGATAATTPAFPCAECSLSATLRVI